MPITGTRLLDYYMHPKRKVSGRMIFRQRISRLSGYIIYYSTDVNAEVHDWVVEPVVGNRLTHQIQGLTLDTAYYFKIQARNSKGMGPMSDAVQFRTPKGEASSSFTPIYHTLPMLTCSFCLCLFSAEPSDKMSSDQGN